MRFQRQSLGAVTCRGAERTGERNTSLTGPVEGQLSRRGGRVGGEVEDPVLMNWTVDEGAIGAEGPDLSVSAPPLRAANPQGPQGQRELAGVVAQHWEALNTQPPPVSLQTRPS